MCKPSSERVRLPGDKIIAETSQQDLAFTISNFIKARTTFVFREDNRKEVLLTEKKSWGRGCGLAGASFVREIFHHSSAIHLASRVFVWNEMNYEAKEGLYRKL